MGKQLAKKITWVIKNFSSLQTKNIYSDQFIVGGCKWLGFQVFSSMYRFRCYPPQYSVSDFCLHHVS